MEPFTSLDAVAVPLDRTDIDTGTIFPSRFLRRARSAGYQDVLFREWRFDAAGAERLGFPLNQNTYRNAQILVTGPNFGCGSARELAVLALLDFGIRCIIAPSYGEIFTINCFRNGLLAVAIEKKQTDTLNAELCANPGAHVRINLESQIVTAPSGEVFHFDITPSRKSRLQQGLDDCILAMQFSEQILHFESAYFEGSPWLLP